MTIVSKTLRETRFAILGFGGTAALMAIVVAAVFPSIRDSLGSIELPEELGTFVGLEAIDYSNPRHYLTGEFFSWVPLLLVVMAIRSASAQLAGEEETGTLELVLALPVPRGRLFAETAAGLLVALVLACTLTGLGFALVWPAVDMEGVSLARTIGATALMLPLLVAVAALTLLAGALAPTKGRGQAAAIAVTVGAYVCLFVSRLHADLEPLRYLSVFYYAGTSSFLVEGVEAWRVGLLTGTTVFLVLVAWWAFEARDIGTHRTPLRRMRGDLRRLSSW